jgi:hypothetical protein
MRPLLAVLLVALVATACTPRDETGASLTPSASPSVERTSSAEPTVSVSPSPVSTPIAPSETARVPEIPVALSSAPFPLELTLALRSAPVDDEATQFVRGGIERYLEMLDHFRATGATNRQALSVYGRFGDAVFTGIKASQDVERKFVIGSLRVDRNLVKPWGTRAMAEATVTILDKAVDGSLPDQSETGRLRLVGDKLFVSDAWDYATGRWFNGPAAMTAAEVREAVAATTANHFAVESWVPGSAVVTFGDESTPYWRARHAYIASLDRTATPWRTFEDVRATVERYETFSDIRDGLATVRVSGTIVTKSAGGAARHAPFERTLRILFGNWIPEVVDEQVTPGVWLSGGDLALAARDVNAA